MNLIDAMKTNYLTRKLDNGLIEIKELYDNGQLEYHYFEDENNQKQGEYKVWREDGTLYKHCYYKDDQCHGECKWWRPDGTLCEHCLYENDEKIEYCIGEK